MDDLDDEFDEFDLDIGALDAAVAAVSQQQQQQRQQQQQLAATASSSRAAASGQDDADEFDDEFEDEFRAIDDAALVSAVDEQACASIASTSTSTSTGTRLVQGTLPWGRPAQQQQQPQNQQNQRQQQQASPGGQSSGSSLSSSNGQIVFGIRDDMPDPTPPLPPPLSTRSYHKLAHNELPTWIYPVNYPVRGYQYSMVSKALFKNTLIALPTGLGKTLIAAVVMYNFYRWFPESVIIFTAPTRPLVEQQIEACFHICGLPQKDTMIMTGTQQKAKRRSLWQEHRVFFCTPQVVDNDMKSGLCPSHRISLIVVDEAHKATGNYAFTKIIDTLSNVHSHFRVLALSATPGRDIETVQQVVQKLRISHIEIRGEESMDVQQYTHAKRIQNIVLPLDSTTNGIVPEVIREFSNVFSPVIERLQKNQALHAMPLERCSPYALMKARTVYMATAKNVSGPVKGMVGADFMQAEKLARAFDAIWNYGVGAFMDVMDRMFAEIRESINSGKNAKKSDAKLLNNYQLTRLMDKLRTQMATPGFVGHPKLDALLSNLLRHLVDREGSRAIVFCSFRNSVNMILKFLEAHKPMINAVQFVGQADDSSGGKGMNQRQQQETIQMFRSGKVNVLVATSVGEEGLDIGEVDLIVCYDSHSSPIRMLQRMGRTGRKRQGHCVMLMTELEERKMQNAKDTYRRVQSAIARGTDLKLVPPGPSVLPEGYKPVLQRKKLVIGHFVSTSVKRQRAKGKSSMPVEKDGTLTPDSRRALLDDLGCGSLQQLDTHHRQETLDSLLEDARRFIPLNSVLASTKRIAHSSYTRQFVKIIHNMEHHALHGEYPIDTNASQASQDNLDRFVLPTRPKDPIESDTLILPSRRLPRAQQPSTSARIPHQENQENQENQDNLDDDASWMGPLVTSGMMDEGDMDDNDMEDDAMDDDAWEDDDQVEKTENTHLNNKYDTMDAPQPQLERASNDARHDTISDTARLSNPLPPAQKRENTPKTANPTPSREFSPNNDIFGDDGDDDDDMFANVDLSVWDNAFTFDDDIEQMHVQHPVQQNDNAMDIQQIWPRQFPQLTERARQCLRAMLRSLPPHHRLKRLFSSKPPFMHFLSATQPDAHLFSPATHANPQMMTTSSSAPAPHSEDDTYSSMDMDEIEQLGRELDVAEQGLANPDDNTRENTSNATLVPSIPATTSHTCSQGLSKLTVADDPVNVGDAAPASPDGSPQLLSSNNPERFWDASDVFSMIDESVRQVTQEMSSISDDESTGFSSPLVVRRRTGRRLLESPSDATSRHRSSPVDACTQTPPQPPPMPRKIMKMQQKRMATTDDANNVHAFFDLEAELSGDDVSDADDGDAMDGEGDDANDSFIHDGSSSGVDLSVTTGHYQSPGMAMYRESLHQQANGPQFANTHRGPKWLDRIHPEKWIQQSEFDDENDIFDDELDVDLIDTTHTISEHELTRISEDEDDFMSS